MAERNNNDFQGVDSAAAFADENKERESKCSQRDYSSGHSNGGEKKVYEFSDSSSDGGEMFRAAFTKFDTEAVKRARGEVKMSHAFVKSNTVSSKRQKQLSSEKQVGERLPADPEIKREVQNLGESVARTVEELPGVLMPTLSSILATILTPLKQIHADLVDEHLRQDKMLKELEELNSSNVKKFTESLANQNAKTTE